MAAENISRKRAPYAVQGEAEDAMKKSHQERKAGRTYGIEQEPERMDLLEKLQSYREEGCALSLGGRVTYPQSIVNACFRENCSYMPDYIVDENDVIRAINYVRVRSS